MVFRKSIIRHANWEKNVSHQIMTVLEDVSHGQMLSCTAYPERQVERSFCKGIKFGIFILVCPLHDATKGKF